MNLASNSRIEATCRLSVGSIVVASTFFHATSNAEPKTRVVSASKALFASREPIGFNFAGLCHPQGREAAPDLGYLEGARAEKRSASRKPSVVASGGWIGTNPGVGYAACRLPAACLPRSVTTS